MRVSIIGAGRNRNGIGEYIGKYFHKNKASIISVLGTKEETSKSASFALGKYGIKAIPYTDFDEMVDNEMPDVAVIASPSSTHYEYVVRCIDLGLHVFCEKPFIWGDVDDLGRKVEDILEKVSKKQLTVAMNSQLPFAVKFYEEACGKIEIKKSNRFFISMSPYPSGKEMISDSVPHALSILYFLFGEGKILDLVFESDDERKMSIGFKYVFKANDCEVLIKLVKKEEQPRSSGFGFNDKIVSRSLDLENYDIYLNYGNKRLKIADPLELSVRDFIEAVEKKGEPLIGSSHILYNMSLLKEIYDRYEGFKKREIWKN